MKSWTVWLLRVRAPVRVSPLEDVDFDALQFNPRQQTTAPNEQHERKKQVKMEANQKKLFFFFFVLQLGRCKCFFGCCRCSTWTTLFGLWLRASAHVTYDVAVANRWPSLTLDLSSCRSHFVRCCCCCWWALGAAGNLFDCHLNLGGYTYISELTGAFHPNHIHHELALDGSRQSWRSCL